MNRSRSLLEWFRSSARELPWRTSPRDAYRTLVSEIMLQQTQVDRVVPRFVEFVRRFPDLARLAAAEEEAVVAAWSGLGYYRRARLLHRLAREVVAHGDGRLPADVRELQRLPGVGRYTAAAVSSLAFGRREPVLDGNVRRVAARVLAYDSDAGTAAAERTFGAWVGDLLSGHEPGEVNEALMELGALVCNPAAPRCEACPLARGCRALKRGEPEAFPRPRSSSASVKVRWVAACCVDRSGRWLLRRVDRGPILEGLWLPPIAECGAATDAVEAARSLLPPAIRTATGRRLPSVKHAITFRRIEVIPVAWSVADGGAPDRRWRWVDPARSGLPTSTLFDKLVKRLQENEIDSISNSTAARQEK